MLNKFLYSLTIFVMLTTTNIAADTGDEIVIGIKHSIHSAILNEDREYWVQLPYNYDESKQYNVIFMLDPGILFHPVSASVNIYSRLGRISESILVGVLNTDRIRDLTPTKTIITSYGTEDTRLENSGGAKTFLAFLTEEFLPKIDKEYSTSGERTIFGHSNGGLFAAYALVENPSQFNRYILVDPTLYWDNEIILDALKSNISNSYDHIQGIYISSANNVDDSFLSHEVMMLTQRNFFEALNNKRIAVEHETFDNEDHVTVPFISIRRGLNSVFNR